MVIPHYMIMSVFLQVLVTVDCVLRGLDFASHDSLVGHMAKPCPLA